MKKLLLMLILLSFQLFSKTVVTGIYHPSKEGGVYQEVELEILKEMKLSKFMPNSNDKITAIFDDFEITLSKTELINEYNINTRHQNVSKLKNILTKKEIDKLRIDSSITALIVKNRASIFDRRNKIIITDVTIGKGLLGYYYDNGRGSSYPINGVFTKNLKGNIMSAKGDISHFSISNHYIKEDPKINKYIKKYKEKKALYEKARATPEIEQGFTF